MEIIDNGWWNDKRIESDGDFDDGAGFNDQYNDSQNYHKVYDHCPYTG